MSEDLVLAVTKAVGGVLEPVIKRPLGELNMIRDVRISGCHATITVAQTISGHSAQEKTESDIASAASSVSGIDEVKVNCVTLTSKERSELLQTYQAATRHMPFTSESPTRVILISSGKGGVGKSTVTAHLGMALARLGLSVGIIDADVHGYSIPAILGLNKETRPTLLDERYHPPVAHGVKVISIGMFLPLGAAAVAWRGPMLHKALDQFLTNVHFGDIDYLLVDMPPGTGDVALTLGKLLPHAEVMVVTTPQATAADVAVRAGTIAHQLGQRLLGVVENMTELRLEDGTVLEVFGSGGGSAVSTHLQETVGYPVPVLTSIPLDLELRTTSEAGEAPPLHDDRSAASVIGELAEQVMSQEFRLGGRV